MPHHSQPHDEPPQFEEPETPNAEFLLLQQMQYQTPAKSRRRLPQKSFQQYPQYRRHRPPRPSPRQQAQRTLSPGRQVVGVAIFVMLAIIVTVIRMQIATTHNPINGMSSTNVILSTAAPPLASHLPPPNNVEQYSLLLAQKSGASGSHFSTYYDARSGNLAITETMGVAQIGARTVLTDCSDIEKAVWQGNIPNLETVTVNIMGPHGPDSLSPIAICTLDKSTEQLLDWDNLTPGQAWEEYNYTWILPGLFEG